MARGWVPARLVALLAGLLGTVAMAETRLQAFEAEIAQPLVRANGRPKGPQNRYPDNGFEISLKARRGTDTGYLMARLQRLDPDVASKIGRGKPYRSINHAAQELGIVARRQLQLETIVQTWSSSHEQPPFGPVRQSVGCGRKIVLHANATMARAR